MFKNRWTNACNAKVALHNCCGVAVLALATTVVSAMSTVMATMPAAAQASDVDRPYLDSPAPRVAPRPRRVDAYQPADTGAGLGVLTSREPPSGPVVAQAGPNDVYQPRNSEPTRPYESYDRVPVQPIPGPNSYPPPPPSRDGYYPPPQGGYAEPRGGYRDGPVATNQGYGQPYGTPSADYDRDRAYDGRYDGDRRADDRAPYRSDGTYSPGDIMSTGHGFFGSMSQGLAKIVENVFKRQGRPNGYILGEEGGGAFVAGLRYGEGTLYTRDAGTRRVYWQGPSVGYDFGGAGSKVMILVYNLHSTGEIYERFGGVDGSAYLVGGLGMTLLTRDHITLAPIRAGVGLRLGANVGYLKFTHKPTWNPF